jgi:hypothetical protein
MPYYIPFDSAVFFFNTIDRDRIKGLTPRDKNKGEVSKNEGGISKNEGGLSKMCVSPRQK